MSVSRSAVRMLPCVTYSHARFSDRCVVRCTTRSPLDMSIVSTLGASARRCSTSMCPMSSYPARLAASLCSGAVAIADTEPSRHSSPARTTHSIAALPAVAEISPGLMPAAS